MSPHEKVNQNEMTFEEIIDLFLKFKRKRVRETTYYNYGNKIPYLKPLFKVKLKDFSYSHFERWHDYMQYETTLATRTKNDIYKFLKSILNYATDWYGFNFGTYIEKCKILIIQMRYLKKCYSLLMMNLRNLFQ